MEFDKKYKVLGIRRENKNKWERRVAIAPNEVANLVKDGIKVIIQPCNLRCYTNKQYQDAGAILSDNIEEADVIIGVKEVPLEYLYKNKTFIYFSHTFKGQAPNMPALDDILEKKIRLVDYELIKEATGSNPQRLVAFGKYAGYVGTIDFLQGLGNFLIYKKIYTPFLHTGFSYMSPSLIHAKEGIKKVGELITQKKLNSKLVPLLFAITGNGRVSHGSTEILELLPHKWIDADEIHELFDEKNIDKLRRDIVYLTLIEHRHMYALKSEENPTSKTFNKEHFYKNKHEYKSVFAEKYLPYISVIFHCMYWDTDSPVIITDKEASDLCESKRLRLLGVTDITCDYPIGSIQLLKKLTKIEDPFYTIDPKSGAIEKDYTKMSRNAILYHAVDHLPAELPFDSSNHFSEKLLPFMKSILSSDYPCDYNEESLPKEILNACEAWNGKLAPKYSYLYKELAKHFDKYKELN